MKFPKKKKDKNISYGIQAFKEINGPLLSACTWKS
jgi:hypothetical protein